MRNLWIAVLCALCACREFPGAPAFATSAEESPVVYGDDDRTDVYAHPDPTWRALANGSSVALIAWEYLDLSNPDDVGVDVISLQEYEALCTGERFIAQPVAADCSGTLIDDDLVLTAGHCVPAPGDCADYAWVFGYQMASAASLATLTTADVFECAERLVYFDDGNIDYAIVRLDRAATPERVPAPVYAAGALTPGQPVTLIGYPSGLPAKIDDGGQVIDARAGDLDYFTTSNDAFSGHSGSGVLTAGGELAGLLFAGVYDDYVDAGGCYVVNVVAEGGASEFVAYAYQAVDDLCALPWPSGRLCGTGPACGDGICSVGETCTADCGPSSGCGDGRCDPGEHACAADCELPAAWRCTTFFYADGAACDCDCGAPDPDCVLGSLEVTHCGPSQRCNAAGSCELAVPVPEAWACGEERYGENEACDCDCGAVDLDCEDPWLPERGCADGQRCVDGACVDPEAIDEPGPGGEDGGGEEPGGCAALGPTAGWYIAAWVALRRRRCPKAVVASDSRPGQRGV